MDWGSIGNAALVGAVAGLIGSGVGSVVGRFFAEKHRAMVTTVFVVLFAVAGPRLLEAFFERPATGASVEQSLLSDPGIGALARAWRDSDPVSFGRYTEDLAAAAQGGVSREDIVNRGRANLQAAAIPRLLQLSDDRILETAQISREQLLQLKESQPALCRPYFVGEPFGDLTPYVSAESVEHERELLVAAFGADMNAPRQTASGEAFSATLTNVLQATRTRVGDDVLMLTGEAVSTGRDVRYCEAAAVFYEEILALPLAEGAAFVRGLRAGA